VLLDDGKQLVHGSLLDVFEFLEGLARFADEFDGSPTHFERDAVFWSDEFDEEPVRFAFFLKPMSFAQFCHDGPDISGAAVRLDDRVFCFSPDESGTIEGFRETGSKLIGKGVECFVGGVFHEMLLLSHLAQ
jgi:hypothetical protein